MRHWPKLMSDEVMASHFSTESLTYKSKIACGIRTINAMILKYCFNRNSFRLALDYPSWAAVSPRKIEPRPLDTEFTFSALWSNKMVPICFPFWFLTRLCMAYHSNICYMIHDLHKNLVKRAKQRSIITMGGWCDHWSKPLFSSLQSRSSAVKYNL